MLSIVLTGSMATEQMTGVQVPLTVMANGAGNPNPSSGHGSRPRTPVQAPTVYLDGHTLTFLYAFSEDIEVQLLDPDTLDDDEPTVVYSTAMYAGAQTVNLPTTYTGDYVLRLVVGSWYFIGEITL